jgi:hypothetical protein
MRTGWAVRAAYATAWRTMVPLPEWREPSISIMPVLLALSLACVLIVAGWLAAGQGRLSRIPAAGRK